MAKHREGNCRICGKFGALSKEHIPPRKAFNDGEYKSRSINRYKTKENVVWQQETRQGGHYAYVICEKCNNNTGQWYGGEYVKYVQTCKPYACPMNARETGLIEFPGIYPLRVFKQVLTIILASCAPEAEDTVIVTAPSRGESRPAFTPTVSDAYAVLPLLSDLILDKNAQGLPEPLHLYTYLMANQAGRFSGVCARGSRTTGEVEIFAESSWWPVGWVLVFDGQIREALTDVTSWSQCGYDQEMSMGINVPCVWVEKTMPLDFRSSDEIKRDRETNKA